MVNIRLTVDYEASIEKLLPKGCGSHASSDNFISANLTGKHDVTLHIVKWSAICRTEDVSRYISSLGFELGVAIELAHLARAIDDESNTPPQKIAEIVHFLPVIALAPVFKPSGSNDYLLMLSGPLFSPILTVTWADQVWTSEKSFLAVERS